MRKTCGALLAVALFAVVPAQARAAAGQTGQTGQAGSPRSTSGFYLGFDVGYLSADTTVFIPVIPFTFELAPAGFVGGVTLGYNAQRGKWMFGVEGDYGFVSASDRAEIDGALDASDIKANGHGRVRFGVAAGDRFTVFAAAGFALARYSAIVGFAGDNITRDKTLGGYSIGGGADIAVSPSVSIRGEYLFDDFGNTTIEGGGGVFNREHDVETHTFRAAVLWRF